MLEGYQIIDREFRYLYVNPASARHGHTTVQELVGRKVTEVYPGIEETEVFGRLREALFENKVHFLTHRFVFADGSIGWFELRMQPVPRGVVVFSIDVTERELERRRNDRLGQRLKQTERLETIGRITGSIAHDFNNILTVLFMGIDVLKESLGDARKAEAEIENLREETQRAARIAQQLIAFSRKKVARLKNLNLNEMVREMEPVLHSLCAGSISLTLALDPEIKGTHADPGFIEQIILNLAVNARDAMPKGGALQIHTKNIILDEDYVNSHASCPAGEYVALIVHDTGVGMKKEVLEKIFEPFFTTKASGFATGLGLATVHGLVHQSGGAIEVYSEPGRGTAFKVYLPAAESVKTAPAEAPAKSVLSGNQRVLLVDDEPNLQRLITHLLKGMGYEVTACGGVAAAQDILTSGDKFDLLISDMSMPGGSGLDVVRAALQHLPEVRILLISGYAADAARLGEYAGRFKMLEKPFSREQLATAIQAATGS